MKTMLCFAVALLLITGIAVADQLQNQIVAQLAHPNPWVQARACYMIGSFGSAETIPMLSRVANDDKRTNLVRIHALTALGRMGDPAGIAFCKGLTSGHGWTKAVKAETAQVELILLLAGRVAAGTDNRSRLRELDLAKQIKTMQEIWTCIRVINKPFAADEALVLLDRHDTQAWAWLVKDFTDTGDNRCAAKIKAIAAGLVKTVH